MSLSGWQAPGRQLWDYIGKHSAGQSLKLRGMETQASGEVEVEWAASRQRCPHTRNS